MWSYVVHQGPAQGVPARLWRLMASDFKTIDRAFPHVALALLQYLQVRRPPPVPLRLPHHTQHRSLLPPPPPPPDTQNASPPRRRNQAAASQGLQPSAAPHNELTSSVC